MRLAITKSGHYHADIYCGDARVARKVLRENPISVLAIDFYLSGKNNGHHILKWAHQHRVLPNVVVIIANDRFHRCELGKTLEDLGFRSADKTTYFRLETAKSRIVF